MLKRRRNARCTAVADSVTKAKILCCIVAILFSTDAAARREASALAVVFENLGPPLFYINHSHTMYCSGNIDVRN